MQPTPTPLPGHGTGWGLLFLLVDLYGIVALLGVGTVVAIALNHIDREIPATLQYLVLAVLLGGLGVAGFIVLVAGRAGRYDVVALLVLAVFVPLSLVLVRRRGRRVGHVATVTRAAWAWSLPFLAGFGVIAFGGTVSQDIPPEVTGTVGVGIVVAGTIVLDSSTIIPDVGRG